jgi:hypothetical protein
MAACRSSLGDVSPRRRILRPRGCYYNPCRNHSRFLLIEARYLDLIGRHIGGHGCKSIFAYHARLCLDLIDLGVVCQY